MKLSNLIVKVVIVFLFLFNFLFGNVFVTENVVYEQPNGVTFIGKAWGDEFLFMMETNDGYRFVKDADGWYYYAELDSSGMFTAGNLKVGIESPTTESYQLQPSQDYLNLLEEQREQAQGEIDEALIWFKQKQVDARTAGHSVTLNVGILLAEFTYPTHYQSSGRPDGYYIEDFEKMFFSDKDDPNFNWYKPNPQPPNDPSPHPEGKELFGSVKDYWREVSRFDVDSVGALKIKGRLINPPDASNPLVPDWIPLNNNMTYYAQNGGHEAEAIYKAKLNGWLNYSDINDPFNFEEFDRIAVVYSFYTPRDVQGSLHPSPRFYNGKGFWDCGERNIAYFHHIGTHAHEFGHTIGLPDEYGPNTGDFFDLMNFGSNNGPNPGNDYDLGSCPALISPYYRIEEYQWAQATEIIEDISNFAVEYNYTNPNYYKIITEDNHNKFFIFENRGRSGFDLWTPCNPNLSANQGGSLLLWKCEKDLPITPSAYRISEFIPADDELSVNHINEIQYAVYDFYPTSKNGLPASPQDLNDDTYPSSNLYYGDQSFIAINNIHADGSNPDIMRVDLFNDYGITTITGQKTWSEQKYLGEFKIVIENGGVLNIQPGTTIYAETKNNPDNILKIIVKNGGIINAIGTEAEPILFHSAGNTNSDWYGIEVEIGGDINLTHCTFNHAKFPINGIEIINETINNITISECERGAKLTGNNINLENCNFYDIPDNSLELSGNFIDIYSCDFTGGTINIRNIDENSELHNSIFIDNTIQIGKEANLKIKENMFNNSFIVINNEDFEENNVSSTIINNLMVGENMYGIAIDLHASAYVTPDIINNTISGYEFGIYCRDRLALPLIKNNIFYQNAKTEDEGGNFSGEDGVAIYNDIYNIDYTGAPIGQNGNIREDPLFVDPPNNDFTLDFDSPCIDAGDPTDDFSNEPFPAGSAINMGHHGNTELATEKFDIIAEGTVNQNTTWTGTVIVKDDFLVNNSADLLINDATYIAVKKDKLISITGKISCYTEEDSIKLTMYRNLGKWKGIFIDGSDEISSFILTKILNAQNGLYVQKSEVAISNCNFSDNNTGFLGDNASGFIDDCLFEDNFMQAAYFSESQLEVINSKFDNNGGRGIYVQYGSGMSFIQDTIVNNAWTNPDMQLQGGIVLYSASPLLQGCEIRENHYNGIVTFSVSDPVMNKEESGFNLISQNGDEGNETEYAELRCMDFSATKLDYGHNDIIDTRGGWLAYSYDESDHEANIRHNYWGTTNVNEIEERIFGFTEFVPIDEEANTIGGGNLSEGERMLQRGLQNESDGNYTLAITTYDSLIQLYPEEVVAINALDRKFNSYKLAGLDFLYLRNEFLDLSVNHSNANVRKRAKNLSVSCLMELEQFSNAIREYDTLIINSQNFVDSLYAETDKALAVLKQSGHLLAKSTGTSVTPKFFKHAIEKSENYRNKTENLLAQRFTSFKKSKGVLPIKFALYQNYPNPFNPVTTIKFDLPKRTEVKLIIYNILGQEIITLLNENKDSGRFEVKWNGRNNANSSVASGLYILKIITNNFTKSKKMLLLR